MRELGLDLEQVGDFFTLRNGTPCKIYEVPADIADALADVLSGAIRRCYISDAKLKANAGRTGRPQTEIVAAVLPDPGSTMSGDFGEILSALFLAAHEYPVDVLDPKKWRLKQDRTKPVSHSDVVQFVLPNWPASSDADRVLCAEAKAKATERDSDPVANALLDSRKDRDGRLIKTLEWLREKAFTTELGTVQLDHLERFINAVDHPAAAHEFHAVVVTCTSLLADVVEQVPEVVPNDYALIIIAVHQLRTTYMAVFDSVLSASAAGQGQA